MIGHIEVVVIMVNIYHLWQVSFHCFFHVFFFFCIFHEGGGGLRHSCIVPE